MVMFNEIFIDDTKNGRKIPKEEYLKDGLYPIIDQGQEYIAGYSNDRSGIYENIPVVIFGDHTRIVKFVDEPFFLGADGVKVLKAKEKDVNHKYLYYALSNAKIPDTGYNRHFKWLKELDFNLANKEKQDIVVEMLDKLESLIEKRKQQLQKLDELVKARFVEMFGDSIENPFCWEKDKLEKHIDLLTGFPFESENYVVEGIKICGGLIIMPQRIEWNSCKYWGSTEGVEAYLLIENDIVMAMDRPWINEGFKIAMVNSCDLPSLLIQRTARIRGLDVNQYYLYYAFILGRFDLHCNVTGSLVPHISIKDIISFEILLPPTSLQEKFADFVKQIDKSKLSVQKSLEKLENLKKALMQKYFG